jgi:DNA polymerase III delta subunit
VKYYDFIDKSPTVGKLVIIEGLERELADRALTVLLDRLLPPDVRQLNLAKFEPADVAEPGPIRDAIGAMPFLAERRVVIVVECQTLRAQPRRDLWEVAQEVPEGNTLVLCDLLSPRSKRPEPMGSLAGRDALRIDTTANGDVRGRFIEETLETLGVKADARVVDELAKAEADLASVRNDLEKLAILGKKITYKDLERETLLISDPKAYKYAGALVEGRTAQALAIAHDMFESEGRNAAVPLLSALATEFGYVWELARSGGGHILGRGSWREGALRPVAARLGETRARAAYERAVRGVEAVVTGRAGSDSDDYRTLVERISAELSFRK